MAVFDHRELSLDHLIELFQQTSVRSSEPKKLVRYISEYLFQTFRFKGLSFFETFSMPPSHPRLVCSHLRQDAGLQEREALVHGTGSDQSDSMLNLYPIGKSEDQVGFFAWIPDAESGQEYDSLQKDLFSILSLIIENAYIQSKQQIMLEEIVGIQLEMFNARTRGGKQHTQNVQRLALEVAGQMGLSRKDRDDLAVGGLLFDIGKIGIPDEILNKPEPLSHMDKEIIMKHVYYGQEIVQSIGHLSEGVKDIVSLHHELLNGSGYPNGILGEKIPPAVRIITVCDVYCALREDRVYRNAWTRKEAFQMLLQGAGSAYDSEVVRILGVLEGEISA